MILSKPVESDHSVSPGRVLCFVSAKGGSGKTVLATSTAFVLLKSGKKVVIIDADFSTRGMSLYLLSSLIDSGGLQVPANSCLAESLLGRVSVEKVAPAVISHGIVDFSVILSNRNLRQGGVPEDRFLGSLSESRSSLFSLDIKEYYAYLGELCQKLSADFDYVIIDTRGGFDFTSAVPAVIADGYIVVLEADEISVQQVHGLKTKLDEYADKLGTQDKLLGFIVNKALYPATDSSFVKALARLYGGQPLGTIPVDRMAIKAYQKKNITIEISPESDFAYYSFQAIEQVIGDRKKWERTTTKAFDQIKRVVRRQWRRRRFFERLEAAYSYVSIALMVAALGAYALVTNSGSTSSFGPLWAVAAAFAAWSVVVPIATLIARWRGGDDRFTSRVLRAAASFASILIGVVALYVVFYKAPQVGSTASLYERISEQSRIISSQTTELGNTQALLFETKAKLDFIQKDQSRSAPTIVTRKWESYQEVDCDRENTGLLTATIPLDPAAEEKIVSVTASLQNVSNILDQVVQVVGHSGNTAQIHYDLRGLPRQAFGCAGGGHATVSATFVVARYGTSLSSAPQ